MRLIKWIKLKWKKLMTSKYVEIRIPKNFKNQYLRNKCLVETKKHILNITQINEDT